MGFASSEEVQRYLGGIFEAAFADEELAPKLKATGLVLEFRYSDPDTVLLLDCTTGTVSLGGSEAVAAAMEMSAETGNGYWQGKVNLPLAMAKGKIKIVGQVAPLLKLAPLSKRLFPVYVERLKADGRDDLLV